MLCLQDGNVTTRQVTLTEVLLSSQCKKLTVSLFVCLCSDAFAKTWAAACQMTPNICYSRKQHNTIYLPGLQRGGLLELVLPQMKENVEMVVG